MPAIRDPGQRAGLYPEVLPLLDGLPKALGGGTKASKGTEGRFVRIELRGPPDADARRGRGLQRRPECRPARQGHARRTPRTAAPPSERSTATRAESTATAARPTPRKTPQPLVGSRPGRRIPDRLDRHLEPDGWRLLHAARPLHAQGPRRRPQRRLRGRQPAGPQADGHDRSGGTGARRSHPARGDGGADLGPRQGGGHVQGAGQVRAGARAPIGPPRSGRSPRIPVADWPADEAGPTLDALLAYIKTIPPSRPDLGERTRRPPARRLAGGLAAARPGKQGPPRAGRPRRPGDPAGHDHRPDALQQGSDRRCRPASRSRSSSRTPTSCRTTSS